MTIRLEPKRPDEKRRYTHDWSAFLGTDTIASQTTTSPDVTVTGAALNGTNKVDFTLSGGTNGQLATVTQKITTAAGDQEDETFVIPIRSADEPVSLTEAKDQLGVLDTSRDSLILNYIAAARRFCENYSGHVFVLRTFTEAFERWGNYIEIGKRPIVSVDSITYTDATGADADFTAFTTSVGRTPLRIYATTPPTLGSNGNIRVAYTAGYADGETPEEARQAILMLVAHWFNQRESVTVMNGVTPNEVPLATTALLDSFKAMVA